jgi:arabinogalactan endo-1,4-beta-galactosidase
MKNIITVFCSMVILLLSGCHSTENKETPDITSKKYTTDQMVMGADLSYVNAIQDNGGKYLDENSKVIDPFEHLSKNGANLVRVRLWHNPEWQKPLYGSIKYHQLSDVTKTIQRAKQAGMQVNLDIHYSDDWADPAKQATPKAWQNANLNVLKDSIYQYTFKVLQHLKSLNLTPEFIQIGNENNGGMCFPLGKISNNNFSNFGQLLQSGIKAVRDFSTSSDIKPKVILHVAQLQNADYWANGVMNQAGVTDFDILGISHYYQWSEVKTMEAITTTIKNLKSKFGKPIMIVETAFPWTTNNADQYNNILSATNIPTGYNATKDDQLKYMKDLTQAIISGGGTGIMYWEPCWISSNLRDQWGTGSSWENSTYYDFTGKPLPVIQFMTAEYKF